MADKNQEGTTSPEDPYSYHPLLLAKSREKAPADQPPAAKLGKEPSSLSELERLLAALSHRQNHNSQPHSTKTRVKLEEPSHSSTRETRNPSIEKLLWLNIWDQLRQLDYRVGDDPGIEGISGSLRESLVRAFEAAEESQLRIRQIERENHLLKQLYLDKTQQSRPSQESLAVLVDGIPLWKDRAHLDPGLDSLAWFDKYWKPHFDRGIVFQRELRGRDEPLYNALYGVCRRKGIPVSDIIPPQQPRASAA